MGAVGRLIDYALGGPSSRVLSETIARIGLHGLGVGLPTTPDQSGEAFFLRAFVQRCGCQLAIDVGAHAGGYAAELLALGARRVVSFEPLPALQEAFEARFSSDSRVQLIKRAVGETNGTISLRYPEDEPQSTIASRGEGGERYTTSRFVTVEVQMSTLDAVLDEMSVTPDFLKVDVEGFDCEVLMGSRRTIESGCLKAIQVEFSQFNQLRGTTLRDFEVLTPEYRWFRLARRSLRPINSGHYLGTVYGYSNLVALRPDIANTLRSLI